MDKKNIAIILAAGKGSRMNSSIPKPLHKIAGKTIIEHILYNINDAGYNDSVIVLNKENESFFSFLKTNYTDLTFAFQNDQLGTGDAVKAGVKDLDLSEVENVLIVFGDTPLLSTETLKDLLNLNDQSDITVLGFETSDPGRYGRLLVSNNKLLKIVEALDANEEEKNITLCNGGVMIVKADKLKENLSLLNNNNAKKEYILSDLIEINNKNGGRSSFLECDYEETIGVDSKKGLSKAEKIYQNKLRDSFMEAGTTILDPETVFFSHDTQIGKDVEIESNIVFGENVTIKDNVVIKSFCSIENSIIHNDSSIGPFARLRNNVDVGRDSKIGNFVELKNSSLENNVKVSHLSYIGDAEIHDSVNIGAGTITCNYDGVNKHKTTIGKRSFIGSNTSLIAPINIGNDANIAAGSSISKDVDSNSLAITRAPIKFINNWSKKIKKTNKEEEKCVE
tara:strand:- start:1806 stop:3158 length:1353 start_codon:yes stop_codon:yes gene_type:complete